MTFGRLRDARYGGLLWQANKATARIGSMDPLGTLIVTLGTLVILDFVAHQLGGTQRPRARARGRR